MIFIPVALQTKKLDRRKMIEKNKKIRLTAAKRIIEKLEGNKKS